MRWALLLHVSKLYRFEKKGRLATLFLFGIKFLDDVEAQLLFDEFEILFGVWTIRVHVDQILKGPLCFAKFLSLHHCGCFFRVDSPHHAKWAFVER